MGLDFSSVATGARLAEGSYVVVQVPDRLNRMWSWDEWAYDQQTGQISLKRDGRTLIPLNYVVFVADAGRRHLAAVLRDQDLR